MISIRSTVVAGVVSIVLAAGFGDAARAAKPVPEFGNFPVARAWHGKVAPTVLQSEQDHRFATRLRELSGKRPNFAGHYAFSSWGCGAACTMAVAVDVETGDTVWLPFTVCCWNAEVRQPVEYRPDSKLVIVRGSRNETGNGTYYYLFDQHRFTLLRGEEQALQKPGR